MTIKRLDSTKIQPQTNKATPKLTIRDGWNFGIGFFVAAFFFTFVIIPFIACLLTLIISAFGLSFPAR